MIDSLGNTCSLTDQIITNHNKSAFLPLLHFNKILTTGREKTPGIKTINNIFLGTAEIS